MRQHNGQIYRAGQVPPLQIYDDRTGDMSEITAGFLPTAFIRQAPGPARDPWAPVRTGLIILGALALVAACAGVGLWLIGQTICPCTFGGVP